MRVNSFKTIGLANYTSKYYTGDSGKTSGCVGYSGFLMLIGIKENYTRYDMITREWFISTRLFAGNDRYHALINILAFGRKTGFKQTLIQPLR
jgi:hypothetical protein